MFFNEIRDISKNFHTNSNQKFFNYSNLSIYGNNKHEYIFSGLINKYVKSLIKIYHIIAKAG